MTSLTPAYPKTFSYYHPIHVRYADLDTLLHVNNVTIMQYVESARIGYYRAAGIWDGSMSSGFGMVVASVHIDFLVSIQFSDEVRVGVRASHVGAKSMRFEFQVESADGETAFARGEVVMVAFNNAENKSRRVPQEWREKLAAFEQNEKFLS